MCGIFGAIGKVNVTTVRSLALANRVRGTDSLGFFNSAGKICKDAGDPIETLGDAKTIAYLEASRKAWFVVGHTRHATQGAVSRRNAHPFKYGSIIGAHNGCCDAPTHFKVDSEYLFDQLNKHANNYQAALGDVSGYWGLVWSHNDSLYLQAHQNTLAYTIGKHATYFSSDHNHLPAVLGNVPCLVLSEGETVRFTQSHAGELMPDFKSTAKAKWWNKSKTKSADKWLARGAGKSDSWPESWGQNHSALLSSSDWAWANHTANKFGFGGFDAFMSDMGTTDERAAMEELENLMYEEGIRNA